MRTSILTVGLLLGSVIVRCTEAAYSVKVAPNDAAYFYATLFVIFAVMDIIDFIRTPKKA